MFLGMQLLIKILPLYGHGIAVALGKLIKWKVIIPAVPGNEVNGFDFNNDCPNELVSFISIQDGAIEKAPI
jgi:hypothetical protein